MPTSTSLDQVFIKEYTPTPRCSTSRISVDFSNDNDGPTECPELPHYYGPFCEEEIEATTTVEAEDLDYYYSMLYNNLTIGFDYEVHVEGRRDTNDAIKYVEGILLEYLAWLWEIDACNNQNDHSRGLQQDNSEGSPGIIALSSIPKVNVMTDGMYRCSLISSPPGSLQLRATARNKQFLTTLLLISRSSLYWSRFDVHFRLLHLPLRRRDFDNVLHENR